MHPAVSRYADAIDHLDHLGGADSPDGELHDLYAQCLEASGRYPDARERYLLAIKLRPAELPTRVRLANLLRQRLERPIEANKIIREMVRANPTADAFLRAHDYWTEFDKSKEGAAIPSV